MPIRLLSPDVVGKIAAGEVVERPVSVVKELVENALDAGARSIHVELIAGGCDLIQVADDGWGIAAEDLPLAVQRHATSKITSAEDLTTIDSLGFRGEALASIAAVSDFTLVSQAVDAASAWEIRLRGGELLATRATARAQGTTVTVERLFFNLPARRKYLRSAAAEAARVAHLLSHLAVIYPGTAFALTVDGRSSLETPGTGDPLEGAIGVLGREVASALLAVEATLDADRPIAAQAARIEGFAADPRVSRSTRSGIWLSVNGRPVTSRALAYAVEEAYDTLLMVGRHPVAIIDLRVPPAEVDVNVHPTKSEVRLLRERLIYGGLRDAVRSVLMAGSKWGRAVSGLTPVESPGSPVRRPAEAPRLIDAPLADVTPVSGTEMPATGRRIPILRLMGQVGQSYIIAEGEEGLYLIDQHAAHERVLLGRLLKAMDSGENTQLLLEPALLELAPAQWQLAKAAWPALESLGFQLEPFGENALLIRGIPSSMPPGTVSTALKEMLQELLEERPLGDWRERMAISLSCRSAVKAGQQLSVAEMKSLVEALEETDITQNCSHGRPTAILLSHRQLEREFGRQ